jgi:rod shape-determining protein MreC
MLAQIAQRFRERPELSTFVVCALCSIALAVLPQSARDDIASAVSAVTAGPFKRAAVAVAELLSVREDNARLMGLVVELEAERAALVEYREEARRLRELQSALVGLPDEEKLRMLPARVIGMPGSRVIERIEIDRGIRDGVDVGMAVVVPGGLIGKVVRVFADRALVEPLGSASSAVSVIVERNRLRGIVRPRYVGAAELASWNMEYVPLRSDVVRGDRVVTSGLGGVYPPGIGVGTVRSVEDGSLTMKVSLDLAVDPSTVEQVFVVLGSGRARSPEGEARGAR